MSQEPNDNDWRLQGQEQYFLAATMYWRRWTATRAGWDHDHCEFCRAKFTDRKDLPEALREGYATEDQYHWVCASCAADFVNRFRLKLIGGPAASPTGGQDTCC